MSYQKHNFESLNPLYASQLNEMDNQIALNEEVSNVANNGLTSKMDLPTEMEAGKVPRAKSDGTIEWVEVGLPTDEQTAAAVEAWLADHPEATTTVLDGSVTQEKLDSALIARIPFLTHGTAIPANTDLHTIISPGAYYCNSNTTARTLRNCPTDRAFRMEVSYKTGNDSHYVIQRIFPDTGEFYEVYNNGVWTEWRSVVYEDQITEKVKSILYPTLTTEQKAALKSLMNAYRSATSKLEYEYNHSLNLFASSSCINPETGKTLLNCNTFVEQVWMGRAVTDITDKTREQYSSDITKVFDFGYYPEFRMRKNTYGLARRDEQGNITGYYGFRQPQAPSYVNSYSRNTYWTSRSTNLYNQFFRSFMVACDFAYELYEKGCGIPITELDVGDLVFSKHISDDNNEEDTFFHKEICWRQIAHVSMVYNKNADGTLDLIECTSGDTTIRLCGYRFTSAGDKTRYAELMANSVFMLECRLLSAIPAMYLTK